MREKVRVVWRWEGGGKRRRFAVKACRCGEVQMDEGEDGGGRERIESVKERHTLATDVLDEEGRRERQEERAWLCKGVEGDPQRRRSWFGVRMRTLGS